jgi:hypothetical protein
MTDSQLQRENRQLKATLLQLRSEQDRLENLYHLYPQLHDFHRVLAWAGLDTYPLTATTDNPLITRTPTPPAPGQNTVQQRRRHQRFQRLLVEWTERLENDLTPTKGKDYKPRCSKRACPGRGRRLPHGSQVCPFCSQPLKGTQTDVTGVPV